MNYKYLSFRENSTYLTFLTLGVASLLIHNSYTFLLINWIILLMFLGNAKRIKHSNIFSYRQVLRRVVLISPYFFPFIFYPANFFNLSRNTSIAIVVSVILSMVYLYINKDKWNILLSEEVVSYSEKRSSSSYYLSILYTALIPVGEEYESVKYFV